MTNDQLRASAPSIFAAEPWHKMSEKYAFIPTIEVVEKLRNEGFVPVKAVQSRTRVPGKSFFTRHQIRFRQMDAAQAVATVGGIVPEVVVTNSHDGASAYEVSGGLFRYVCTNGLMVDDGIVAAIKVPHRGTADGIIEASFEVIDQMPRALESVESFRNLRLAPPERAAFATAALALRYDDAAPITPEAVVRPRRTEDAEPTLWNTFNVAQENLTQGGARYRNATTGRRGRVRPVEGISENTRLNKALWTLAEEMKKLKS
jgi:hypothetical protein